ALSVRLELQADCFAGVWAYHANQARGVIENGDIETALNAATAIGDDALQQQAQGYVVPDSFTHGTSAQRVRWFKRGIDSGTDDLLAINERLSQTLQSGSQLAFDWLIPGDRLHFTSGVPENFRHVALNGINNSINLHQLMHDDDKDTFQFAVRDTINLDKNP